MICGNVSIDCVIQFYGCHGYDGLVDVEYEKHFCDYHGKNEFIRGHAYINENESLGICTKWFLAMLNDIPLGKFYFFMKGCEFRFNQSIKISMLNHTPDIRKKSLIKLPGHFFSVE